MLTESQTFALIFANCSWCVCDHCMKLHGSKVSRESDLRSVPYNRPVGVRSFVKNVKLFSENQHNA